MNLVKYQFTIEKKYYFINCTESYYMGAISD